MTRDRDPQRNGLYIARQPIYNRNLGIVAYELLFRSGTSVAGRQVAADTATSQVILSTFVEIGLDGLVGTRLAAINMTARLLEQLESLDVPARRVILDLPPDLPRRGGIPATLQRLAQKGFLLALDDYTGQQHLEPLLSVVHMVKIPMSGLGAERIRELAGMCKTRQKLLLAEEVESLESYEFLRDEGFDLFQGYFLSRPRVFRARSLPARKLTVLRLLARLQTPEVNPGALVGIINEDVGLSYKLLRLINSPFFGLGRQMDSVARAVVILGQRRLASWACMLAMAGLDERPPGLMHIALKRARLGERLAELSGLTPTQSYFTAGMFSALDLLMERPLEQLIPPLPLDDLIKRALLNGEGVMGEAIRCGKACETGDQERIGFQGLPREEILTMDLEATQWADQVLENVGLANHLGRGPAGSVVKRNRH